MGLKPKLPCSDAAVQAKTGRTWAEWRKLLDKAGAAAMPHKAIATLVYEKYHGGDWWSQMVAVGYERMLGLRAANQRRDGSFEASASKTMAIGAGATHKCFVDRAKRTRWLKAPVVIRTSIAPKSVRMTWPDETHVDVWITAKGDAKCAVAVQHKKLRSARAVAAQKKYWREALGRLAQAAERK